MSCALELYGLALRDGRNPLGMRYANGSLRRADLPRWLGSTDAVDDRVLRRVDGPVLDVGSGPGRHVSALARRGIYAVGLDPCSDAVRIARSRGSTVVGGSVFDCVVSTGHWRCGLLLDGNIGIGGDPQRLLCRLAQLLQAGGRLVVELDPPGAGVCSELVQLEYNGSVSERFWWAHVGAGAIAELAASSGFAICERWHDTGRWFAELERMR